MALYWLNPVTPPRRRRCRLRRVQPARQCAATPAARRAAQLPKRVMRRRDSTGHERPRATAAAAAPRRSAPVRRHPPVSASSEVGAGGCSLRAEARRRVSPAPPAIEQAARGPHGQMGRNKVARGQSVVTILHGLRSALRLQRRPKSRPSWTFSCYANKSPRRGSGPCHSLPMSYESGLVGGALMKISKKAIEVSVVAAMLCTLPVHAKVSKPKQLQVTYYYLPG